MVRLVPHYFLFTESFVDHRKACGVWRFTLQEIDGDDSFEVVEREPGVDGERLELLSVVRGLEALDQPTNVVIVTPSRYVSRGFRFGLDQWRENDWCWERFGTMRRIKNDDLWQRVDRAMKYHSVQCRCWNFESGSKLPKTRKQSVKCPTRNQKVVARKKLSAWSGRAIARLADQTKNWALRFSGAELESNQFA